MTITTRFSRLATAAVLLVSIWLPGVAIIARQTAGQSSTQQSGDANSSATKKKQAPSSSGQTSTNASKPLSTDEDPAMIGKRNINHGIFASRILSGSLEKEVAMGRQIAAEVDRTAKFIEDPIITEYINRVGQNLVLHSDAKIPFTIKVIDSDEVNAFALPGGFFYVNKGLLLAADNEAELAGAMAHEIAHVCARHAVENQAKATVAQYAILIPAIIFGGGIGQAIYQGGNFGALLGFMSFSRAAESEADKLGVQYLYAAGYDPNAMATMFEKLAAQNKKKPGKISRAFSSHPQPPDRQAASITLVARFPEREEYMVSTSEFQRVRRRLLATSNARVTTAGDLSNGTDANGGRPTLKRRNPSPDETPTADGRKQDSKPAEPPKLKRNDTTKPPSDQPQANPTPTPMP